MTKLDATQIKIAAEEIRDLMQALEWMREYGKRVLGSPDREAFGITVSINSCSALPGAKEAAEQLGEVAFTFGPQILEAAIEDAENTIEIYRQQIERAIAISGIGEARTAS